MTILIVIAVSLVGFACGFGSGFVAGYLKAEAMVWTEIRDYWKF